MSTAAEPVATAGAATENRPGWRGKWWFWLPWPPLVVLDLWSKAAVFGFLERRYPQFPEASRPGHNIFGEGAALRFDLVTWGNTGTIWGLFQNGTVVLMVLRCLAVFGLLWFVRHTRGAARWQLLVLSLVFAGALGNLYDNFVRADRSVRDFLHFSGTWPWRWDFPAFNVADSCITVGAIGLFLLLWRDDRKQAGDRNRGAGQVS
ncbi:MAG: signal peptidase II [Planctomycetes bacterium]|nr:signal peptidase II [Planctomycetota bacterium]